jgi:hypothetical protein
VLDRLREDAGFSSRQKAATGSLSMVLSQAA